MDSSALSTLLSCFAAPLPAGVGLALLSAASWAAASTLFQRLGAQTSPLGLSLLCALGGALVMAPVALAAGEALPPATTLAELALSGVLGVAVGDTLYFAALQRLGAVAVIVLALLAPVLTMALSVVLLGERPPLPAIAAGAVVLLGVAVVLTARLRPPPETGAAAAAGTPQGTAITGVLYGLAAVLTMSLATVAAKRGLASADAAGTTVVRLGAGAVALLVVGVVRGDVGAWLAPLRQRRQRGALVGAVLLVALGGFYGMHAALRCVDLSLASAVFAAEPLFALPLARWLLGERLSPQAVVGTAISVAGVAMLLRLG